MTTINYNIQLEKDLKDSAFAVLESYDLTPFQAIKLFLMQVAQTNTVPLSFDYLARAKVNTILEVADNDSQNF